MSYILVAPENFTPEHKQIIEKIKEAARSVSPQRKLILAAKDINSRFVISNDAGAIFMGMKKGEDITGMLDSDIPCEGIASYADNFVQEDQQIVKSGDENKELTILEIYEYCTGIMSFLTRKSTIKHDHSHSILGVTFEAMEIKLTDFITFIPNYFTEFGQRGSINKGDRILQLEDVGLTEYEHEICFLLTLNWNYRQIANFMNKYRPLPEGDRVADTLYKCINRIRDKLDITDCNDTSFREMLIHVGVHQKMPPSFFNRLIGSHILH